MRRFMFLIAAAALYSELPAPSASTERATAPAVLSISAMVPEGSALEGSALADDRRIHDLGVRNQGADA